MASPPPHDGVAAADRRAAYVTPSWDSTGSLACRCVYMLSQIARVRTTPPLLAGPAKWRCPRSFGVDRRQSEALEVRGSVWELRPAGRPLKGGANAVSYRLFTLAPTGRWNRFAECLKYSFFYETSKRAFNVPIYENNIDFRGELLSAFKTSRGMSTTLPYDLASELSESRLIPGCTNIFPNPRSNEPSSKPGSKIWAALNNEVLRTDESEMSREWSSAWMQGRGNGSSPRKPADQKHRRHDSHIRKSGSTWRYESVGVNVFLGIMNAMISPYARRPSAVRSDFPVKPETTTLQNLHDSNRVQAPNFRYYSLNSPKAKRDTFESRKIENVRRALGCGAGVINDRETCRDDVRDNLTSTLCRPPNISRTRWDASFLHAEVLSRLTITFAPPAPCTTHVFQAGRRAIGLILGQGSRLHAMPASPVRILRRKHREDIFFNAPRALSDAVHTRRTQQEPVTRVEREKQNVLLPLTRERRGTHYTRAVTSTALHRVPRCENSKPRTIVKYFTFPSNPERPRHAGVAKGCSFLGGGLHDRQACISGSPSIAQAVTITAVVIALQGEAAPRVRRDKAARVTAFVRHRTDPPRLARRQCLTRRSASRMWNTLKEGILDWPAPEMPDDKIDVQHVYTEVTFAIGSQFFKHVLDDYDPIADLEGNRTVESSRQVIELAKFSYPYAIGPGHTVHAYCTLRRVLLAGRRPMESRFNCAPCRFERAWETPQTCGIVRQESRMLKSGSDPSGVEADSYRLSATICRAAVDNVAETGTWLVETSSLTTSILGRWVTFTAMHPSPIRKMKTREHTREKMMVQWTLKVNCTTECSGKLTGLAFGRSRVRLPRLARPPPTKANRVQSPAGSPDFRKWESCRTMPLVGGFSRGLPSSRGGPVLVHLFELYFDLSDVIL
ncbi:hypothetical protein PR048_026083 [Dryococelus australis]|uniref:BTB domain-containing protein n=1 Tax=Dryococelus australis TaxID=614101 RepID=A0ABQ9GKC8_9NEOP|nr:hypothetical protein PR048_026083 [Dryococelus australis]